MKEKILQLVDAYWKFDNEQQPISSWHDKQDLLKALEELFEPADVKSIEYNINSCYDEEKAEQITEEGRKILLKILKNEYGICDDKITDKIIFNYSKINKRTIPNISSEEEIKLKKRMRNIMYGIVTKK